MKSIKLLSLFALLFIAFNASAQTKAKPKKMTATILTSAVCGECKERIEDKLNYTKGVIFAELDLDTKKVTVKYKTKHISEGEIIQIIADLGYDAGKTKRNAEAFNALPKCCQAPGHCSGE